MAWYRGDCHVHSHVSQGGELTPEELASAAREAGLDFVVVTEHNTAQTHAVWQRLASADLLVVPGQEVVTETGHWLAVGLEPGQVVDWRYGVRHDRIGAAMAEVHRVGGLCVAAHPHAPYPSGTFAYRFAGFDAVEVWNGRWSSDLPWNADNEAALAEWGRGLAADIHSGRWRPAIGNSDVHLRGQIGTPQTVVRAPELGREAILSGIRAGNCWIAGSAAVRLRVTARSGDRVAGVGDRLTTDGGAASVRVEVGGVPSGVVSLHTERGRAHHAVLPGAGAGSPAWSVHARESAFVRVEVRDADGHLAALTNPILLT
jgi:hypothetical protein